MQTKQDCKCDLISLGLCLLNVSHRMNGSGPRFLENLILKHNLKKNYEEPKMK